MTSLVKTAAGWCVRDAAGTGLLPEGTTLGSLLALPADELAARAAAVPRSSAVPGAPLAPVDDDTEVWAAGVTYEVSRAARMEESGDADVYARVYEAERPELFFKTVGRRVRGPGEAIGVRADSTWDVPEPELAVVANAAGEIVGYTVVNDVSSRSIEGENPLYLPQAKSYRGSCAAGPEIVLADAVADPYTLAITVRIDRAGAPLWSGETTTARLHRKLPDLVAALYRADFYPRGVVLATGTSAVPGPDVTLEAGDEVTISIDSVGTLRNPVRRGLFA
ncbi:fumarylacetoacetate hydrolase family protein [Amycolatopsis rhabdoformis]|uniref:Fumarylacetoacetate hydrolase family protein n=1 Tax=Amycolatopsis rhabdoformis TaxID=1448059 RepID=A0ABZ1IH96_9PSEU|nr:fumarylacetoacetate hydrolase family protein [Amycolatopsis rhabdoformis]WSE33762.1 fumarylacetoacetate hydrolase family protein [Amycolatopsis rhabdoformis]